MFDNRPAQHIATTMAIRRSGETLRDCVVVVAGVGCDRYMTDGDTDRQDGSSVAIYQLQASYGGNNRQ